MAKAIERILANNLADFEGLKIEGTIVVNEALINVFINDFVNNIGKTPETKAPVSAPANPSTFDMQQLLQALCIDKVNVQLQEGKMYIDIKISK